MRSLRCIAWGGCALLLLACGPETPEDMLVDYSARVHNALGVEGPGDYVSTLESYPRRRDLRFELGDLRIGLVELVSLERCGLEELVAARNSGLGKVMPPSQQLLYEHRLLARARVCADTLRAHGDAPELLARLQEVIQIKVRDLPRAYWNATFASDEFSEHFSLATQALPLEQEQDSVPQVQALYYLRDLSPLLGQPAHAIDSAELEQHFFSLQNRSYGGQLLLSMELLSFYLEAVARAIEGRQFRQSLCPQGVPTPKAKVMQTVFLKFYAAKTQPYLTRVHREASAWGNAVDGVLVAQAKLQLPASFIAYRARHIGSERPTATRVRFAAAIERHTSTWQDFFSECGLQPFNSSVEKL